MGLTSGAITCRSYYIPEPPAKHFLEKADKDLKRHAFQPVRVELSPRSLGWVNARQILDTELSVPKVVFEDFLILGLRVDKVTVNARILKAHYNQERVKALEERKKKQLSRDERTALLDKVRLTLMGQQSPATSIHEMAWNLTTNHVYFSGLSDSLNQEFCDLFSDTFHASLTPLFPFIRADLKATKEGLREELLQTEPARFAGEGNITNAIQEEE
jgi:hypothetical protein